MKPIFEISRFADGRLMLRVRFRKNSNFRFEEEEEATWVPTFDEVNLLNEALNVTNEHNTRKTNKSVN